MKKYILFLFYINKQFQNDKYRKYEETKLFIIITFILTILNKEELKELLKYPLYRKEIFMKQ